VAILLRFRALGTKDPVLEAANEHESTGKMMEDSNYHAKTLERIR
jgi:hypothetical protein